MTVRATMADLIDAVQAMCNGDTTLTDQDYQDLLDQHSVAVDALLEPRPPFYTTHLAPFEWFESGTVVYVGYNTVLTETADYTFDEQRGIVTTPAANYQGLKVQGTAYDVHAAAADGWERIAARSADLPDVKGDDGSMVYQSQLITQALTMAKTYRRKAWAMGRVVERADTPNLDTGHNWNSEALRRAKAGY